jgi:hypothetical protein
VKPENRRLRLRRSTVRSLNLTDASNVQGAIYSIFPCFTDSVMICSAWCPKPKPISDAITCTCEFTCTGPTMEC